MDYISVSLQWIYGHIHVYMYMHIYIYIYIQPYFILFIINQLTRWRKLFMTPVMCGVLKLAYGPRGELTWSRAIPLIHNCTRHRGFVVAQFSNAKLQWRHNGPLHCLFNRLFMRRSADQRKHRSSASLAFVRIIHQWPAGEFPTQMVVNAENVFIWWRHHVYRLL